MERLEKSAPTVKLSDEQEAQIAEKELFLKGKMEEAGFVGRRGRDQIHLLSIRSLTAW